MKHIVEIFKEQVVKIPNNLAIVTTEGVEYTYSEVDEITDNLARYFLSKGIKENSIVPIIMKRDEYLVLSILSLFKIGAAYIPIPDTYTTSRIKYILEDFDNTPILTNLSTLKCKFNLNNTVYNVKSGICKLGENKDVYEIDNIAYIMFTSGTSGKPKGVVNTHKQLAWIIHELQNMFPVNINDNYLFTTPFSFDVSISEIFGWIAGGGKLIIPCMTDIEIIKNLNSLVSNYNISHIALSPSVLQSVVSLFKYNITNTWSSLKYLMVAGETFPVSLANELLDLLNDVKVINLYGPTEATVYCTMYEIKEKHDNFIPIGKPLNNTNIKILNDELDEGIEGELFISGNGVAKEYYNNPSLTKSKFIVIDGIRYYKTGDFGYKLKDGNIKFLGRRDSQVQINGIRVELSEIESLISEKTSVNNVKVIYYDKKIICFYCSKSLLEKSYIERIACEFLPKHMIPKIFLEIDEIKLNTNRKADINYLIDTYKSHVNKSKCNISSDNSYTKLKIEKIIRDVLKIDIINDSENFFSLGGDSLSAIELIIKLEESFRIKLHDDFIYLYPTLNTMTSFITSVCNDDDDALFRDEEVQLDININSMKNFYQKINNKIIHKNVKRIFDSHYLQKVYYYDNFNSYINLSIQIPANYSMKELELAITKFINRHELFRSTLVEDNRLLFKEYCDINELSNSVLIVDECNKYKVNSLFEDILTENTLNNILYMFYISKNNKIYKLNFIISHMIMDQKSVHVMKQEFYKILNNEQLPEKDSYVDFVSAMKKYNDDYNFMQDISVKQLIGIDKYEFNQYTDDKIPSINFKLEKINGENNKIIHIIDKVLNYIMNSLEIDELISSTILNYRKFDNYNFVNSIGDYHTAIVFRYTNKLNSNERKAELLDIFAKYKNGYQPLQYIFKDYPYMDNLQKKLEYVFDLNSFVSINYMGEVKEEDLLCIITDLTKTRDKLKVFPGKKIYVTCFTCEGICYSYFLTLPNKLKGAILKNDCMERV